MEVKSNPYNNPAIYETLLSPFNKILSNWRSELLKDIKGNVLEVRIGTGMSLRDYPEEVRITGIDASKQMLRYAIKKAKKTQKVERLILMNAEELNFDDESFDNIVATCVFCTIQDPVKALKEIKRVCKKGGTIFLLEHVRSNHSVTGKLMDIFNPITVALYNDHINRQTYENIIQAGFKPEEITKQNLWKSIWYSYKIKRS